MRISCDGEEAVRNYMSCQTLCLRDDETEGERERERKRERGRVRVRGIV